MGESVDRVDASVISVTWSATLLWRRGVARDCVQASGGQDYLRNIRALHSCGLISTKLIC